MTNAADLTNLYVSGLMVTSSTSNNNRFVSGKYLGDGATLGNEEQPDEWGNFAFSFVNLGGTKVLPPQSATADLGVPDAWVAENLDTYWRGVADALATGVADSDESEWGGEVLEWVALGVARMLYTFETGDVTSKSAAGRWAAERVPGHEALFRRAVEVRSVPGSVTRDELLECADVAREIVAAVTQR